MVAKFGGTSLATPERWRQVARRVRAALASGTCPVIVLSAVATVTDALVEAADRLSGGHDPQPPLQRVARVYAELARALEVDPKAMRVFGDDTLDAVRTRIERGEETLDALIATGESLSCALAARYFARLGIGAVRRPSRAHLITTGVDPRTGQHAVVLAGSLLPSTPAAVLVEGFSVGTPEGGLALLGRGGSDLTATLLASLLGAGVCEIWTDVAGFYSADPRLVPDARHYPALSYDAAESMAAHGAKVLQAAAIAPARRSGTVVIVQSTMKPEAGATVISADGLSPEAIRAVGRVGRELCVLGMEPRLLEPGERVTAIPGGFRVTVAADRVDTRLVALHATLYRDRGSVDVASLGLATKTFVERRVVDIEGSRQ